MKSIVRKILYAYPPLHLFVQIFANRIGAVKGDLQSVHDKYRLDGDRFSLDLGCGPNPRNHFFATNLYGIDLYEDLNRNIYEARLGFEPLPFKDDYFDYVTAYDLLEHIPRHGDLPQHGNAPFIFLMNEIYRVLKPGGIFMSTTPIYPYLGAFKDPTHVNFMTSQTLREYFSIEKFEIARHYGIKCNYEILYQGMLGQNLVAVLRR